MKKYNLITPEGTRDLLFDECTVRRDIEKKLMKLFKKNKYHEVITPMLEFYDVFEGYFPQEKMYKLTDTKGRLMVLRPDSTLPIIRLAETRLEKEPRLLKLCYNQPIYRSNPKEAGRDDEIVQCGIEKIGGESHFDESVFKLAVEVFNELKIDYRFELGDCRIFNRLIIENNISEEKAKRIRMLVNTKNYPELKAEKIPKALEQLPKLFGGAEVIEKVEKIFTSDTLKKRLKTFENSYLRLCECVGKEKITIDLGLMGRQDYYTGTIFNGYIKGFGRPVLEGGRYKINNTNATGFAVNVSAIAELRG